MTEQERLKVQNTEGEIALLRSEIARAKNAMKALRETLYDTDQIVAERDAEIEAIHKTTDRLHAEYVKTTAEIERLKEAILEIMEHGQFCCPDVVTLANHALARHD